MTYRVEFTIYMRDVRKHRHEAHLVKVNNIDYVIAKATKLVKLSANETIVSTNACRCLDAV